jgi:hypothetical protein
VVVDQNRALTFYKYRVWERQREHGQERRGSGNGKWYEQHRQKQAVPGASKRSPRRIDLLSGDEHGEVSKVLLEMNADESRK